MKNNAITLRGLSVWLIIVVFYLYEFLLRTVLGTFQQPIMADLQLDTLNFAFISSTSYLLIYGLMQVPVGAILRKWGFKRSMILAALICSVSTLGFSYSASFGAALFFRALMGLGSAFGFIGVLIAVYDWMPRKNMALFIGLSQFLGTLGPILAAGPLDTIAYSSAITWDSFFVLLSFFGFGLTLLIALIVIENNASDSMFVILKKNTPVKNELFAIARLPQFWCIAIFCALIYFSLEYLSENEGKNLLMAKGFTSAFSSYMISLAWLGFAIGSPLFGYISDRISRRKPILILSASTTFAALFAIIYLPLGEIGTIISFMVYGMGAGSASVGIALMAEQFTAEQVPIGLGMNNAISILTVSLLAPIMSYILMLMSNTKMYVLIDFQQVFVLLAIMPLLAGFIAILGVKETFGKSYKVPIVLNYKKMDT